MWVGMAAVAGRARGSGGIGPTAVLFYLGGYAATNLAAFCVIIAISTRVDSDEIDDFAGMARRAPVLAAVLALAMISLIGVPPTVGFWAKVYLFGAAINSDLIWLAVIGVINSVVSAYYYLRVVKVMYLNPPKTDETALTSPLPIRVAISSQLASTLFFRLYPPPLLELAGSAAAALLS